MPIISKNLKKHSNHFGGCEGFFLAVILLSNSMELSNSVVHLGVGCSVCSSSPASRIWQFHSPQEVRSVVTHSNLLILQKRALRSREETWLCTPSLSGLVAELELDPPCLMACLSAGCSSLPLASVVTSTDQDETWVAWKEGSSALCHGSREACSFYKVLLSPHSPPPACN